MTDMEKMLKAVEKYAERKGWKPSTVLQYAANAGSRYEALKAGEVDMTSKVMARVYAYIKADGKDLNP